MKKNFIIVSLLLTFSISLTANEQENLDKLDVLEQQSKDFFKAITGLEKDYYEEQVNNIETRKTQQIQEKNNRIMNSQNGSNAPLKPELTKEEKEKDIFKHQNEIARLTTDFTRTKKLKDIKIKSMYSFNGKEYVVLKLQNSKVNAGNSELTSNIEGRYVKGDYILGHKITSVNVRTKSIKLYKKLDDEYGYNIYLNNYGISVSDLIKLEKVKKKDEVKKTDKKEISKVKDVFEEVEDKVVNNSENPYSYSDKEKLNDCLYTVNVGNLNVRNSADLNATILRILRKNDQFTIVQKNEDWLQIDTIYKKTSGDVMPVSNQDNWVNITLENVKATNSSCL